jgi:SAM-dependent methyltransferase
MAEGGGAEFDVYAQGYERALDRGLASTGEDMEYFARGRAVFLATILRQSAERVSRALDFGCGTGRATPFLLAALGLDELVGVDVSAASLCVARESNDDRRVEFLPVERLAGVSDFDLVFCNGVFHHIPVAGRSMALGQIYDCVRPGGLFALWENNPWNPGTRYVMRHCEFDRDAVMLSPLRTSNLARSAGFEIIRTDFLFVFPHALRVLRGVERCLSRLPLGGQYQVLCRRPR